MKSGLLVTGTSGAGKSTISSILQERDSTFCQVTAVTTRQPRDDDKPNSYEYLDEARFSSLDEQGELMIRAEYRGRRYGITFKHVRSVEESSKTPIIVATPESIATYFTQQREKAVFCAVFVDASDDELDNRLGARQAGHNLQEILAQRVIDRTFANSCDRVVMNSDLEVAVNEVYTAWQAANR